MRKRKYLYMRASKINTDGKLNQNTLKDGVNFDLGAC